MDGTGQSGVGLLFLTDAQLRRGSEALFFAYRAFTSDPDAILAEHDLGRAHHRALHFISRRPGMTVTALLAILGVTKQSLNRVLRALTEAGFVRVEIGRRDRRERNLYLTESGTTLEERLSGVQRERLRRAFRDAGPEAVRGFRQVLEAMMGSELRHQYDLILQGTDDG